MTVILYFRGGPRDGGWRRIASEDLEPGKQILIEVHRHCYCSQGPWYPVQDHVSLWYQGRRRKLDKASKLE